MKHPTQHISVRAPVDVLIIPLIQALQQFPEVATIHSCQGNPVDLNGGKKNWSWEKDSAYVILRAGQMVIENAVFLEFLSEQQAKLDTYIRLELAMVDGAPQIELRFQQESIVVITNWLLDAYCAWRGLHEEMLARFSKFQAP